MSRGTTFSCGFLQQSMEPSAPFLCARSASLSSVTGSPGIAYTPARTPVRYIHHIPAASRGSIPLGSDVMLSGFSHSVQKLPSAPALPDRLSADEPSSLLARGAYSSFSTPFSDVSYLNEGTTVCQAETLQIRHPAIFFDFYIPYFIAFLLITFYC